MSSCLRGVMRAVLAIVLTVTNTRVPLPPYGK